MIKILKIFNFFDTFKIFFLCRRPKTFYVKLTSEILSEELAVVAKFALICTRTGILEKSMSLKLETKKCNIILNTYIKVFYIIHNVLERINGLRENMQ